MQVDKTWVYDCGSLEEAINAAKGRLEPEYEVCSVMVYDERPDRDRHRVHLSDGDILDRYELSPTVGDRDP